MKELNQTSDERRGPGRVRDDQRSGHGSASALSRHKMLERKNRFLPNAPQDELDKDQGNPPE